MFQRCRKGCRQGLLFHLFLGEGSKNNGRINRAEQESPPVQIQDLCLKDLHKELEGAIHSLGEVSGDGNGLDQRQQEQQNAHTGNISNGHPNVILAVCVHIYGNILFSGKGVELEAAEGPYIGQEGEDRVKDVQNDHEEGQHSVRAENEAPGQEIDDKLAGVLDALALIVKQLVQSLGGQRNDGEQVAQYVQSNRHKSAEDGDGQHQHANDDGENQRHCLVLFQKQGFFPYCGGTLHKIDREIHNVNPFLY